MELLNGIAGGAPIWVWPLLLGLIGLGVLSTRTRSVPRGFFYALPLLGLITLNSAMNLPQPLLVWPCFIMGFAAGAFVAHGLQSRWILGRTGNRLTVSGEWMTFTVLMIIFWANFIAGAVQAISPAIYGSAGFVVAFTLVIALASGSFLGRSIRALRYVGVD